MRPEDYAPSLWSALASEQKRVAAELKGLGDLVSLTLVGRFDEGSHRVYRYRIEFGRAIVLQRFAFNERNQVVSIQSEANELKPGASRKRD